VDSLSLVPLTYQMVYPKGEYRLLQALWWCLYSGRYSKYPAPDSEQVPGTFMRVRPVVLRP
jgi:hypothetical protein